MPPCFCGSSGAVSSEAVNLLPPTSPHQTSQSAQQQPLPQHSSPSMGHWGLHLDAERALVYTPHLCIFYRFDYCSCYHYYYLIFAQRNFFGSSFHSETFTYGSRIWGQVVVSLGETSSRCFCCCCWKVRFIISSPVTGKGWRSARWSCKLMLNVALVCPNVFENKINALVLTINTEETI